MERRVGLWLSGLGGCSGYPASQTKAAEGRYLLPIVRRTMIEFFPPKHKRELVRFQCLDALNSSYLVLGAWVDDGTSARRLSEFGITHLMLYGELSKEGCARYPGGMRWRMYPKHHLFTHCIDRCTSSPTLEWNYREESQICVCAKLAGKANVRWISTRMIRRYRLIAEKPSL